MTRGQLGRRAGARSRVRAHLRSPAIARAAALGLLLTAAIALGGCGMGTTELPATTQPGGPGFLSITTPELADGVQGLSYSATINTAGGSSRLASCTVISGNLPSGFGPLQTQGSQCVLSTSDPAALEPGRYTFTLEAGDTSTPQRTDNHVYSLTVRPTFTINAPVIPDAVTGRSYARTFAITSNLQNHVAGQSVVGSGEAGNGPATSCSLAGLPAPFTLVSCAIGSTGANTTVTMSAGAASLAPGVYPFSISVTDSPIPQATGAGTAVPAQTVTLPLTLAVRQEFSVTQASLSDAVQGRTYGVTPLAQPAATSVVAVAPASNSGQTAELGNGPLTGCSVSASPADPALGVIVDPANRSRCLLTNASPVAASGTYAVAVSATDSPIVDPASGQMVVPANTHTRQFTWVVSPPISYSLNFDSVAGQAGQVPDSVEGRTYGASPKTPVILTATGGLSTTDGLSIAQTGNLPAGVSCTSASPSNPQPPGATATLTCSSSGQLVGAPAGATNFAVTVSDRGNTATPGGSISNDANGHASHLLNVDAPLGLAVSISDPLPAAVSGRSYAVAPSAPLVYTATGGLSGYHFTTPADAAAPTAAFPQGFLCTPAPTTFSCSASAITAAGSTTAFGPIPVTLDDTANQTTPDGAASSPITTAVANRTLLLNPPLTIVASGSAGVQLPAGVAGRAYGAGTGFSPLVYTAEGGDPPYTFAAIESIGSPSSNGLPGPAACSVGNAPGQTTSGDQLICMSASGISAAAGAYPFSVSVQDSGSAGVAAASTSLAQSVTVDPALSLTPQLGSIPLAVVGRTYGDPSVSCSGAPCQAVGYNISGGLGGYSESGTNPAAPVLSGFPGVFTCPFTSSGTLSGSYACYTTSAVAGSNPSALSITATDTQNAATPAASVANSTLRLQVNQPLTLAPPAGEAPPTAVFNRAYGAGIGCLGGACKPVVYNVANGTGVYPASATLTTSAGPFACALSGATYNCESAGITLNPSTPATAPLSASVTDVANASAPAGTATDASLTLTVNPALAVSGPSGTLAIAVSSRTYGAGSSCGAANTSPCATIAYTVTNGLGGYSTTPTLNGYPATFQCPFTSTGALSGSYACSSPTGVTAVGTPANDAVSVTASDTANASTPSANATSGTATLPVSPLLSFTPPSTVNPAVTGRAYGTGSGCSGGGGACQPLAYGIANGTTVFAASATMATSAGAFSCSLSGAIYNCSSAGITGAVSPATLGISVSDVANASTPSGSASDSSKTLTIDAPLTLSLTSGAPAPSVVGRAYGSGGGCSGGNCTPITYSISGGLGGYTNPVTLTGAPQAISALICSLSGSTYTCSAGSLGPASLGSQTDDTLTATVSDTANVSTPASSVTNTSASLTLDPAMTIAPATGQGTPTNAVVNAAYGSGAGCSGGNCAPIKYTVAGGLGNYAGAATLTESPTALTGFACPISGTTYSCSASPLGPSLSSQATDTLSVTTSETGNASTPGATTPANTSLSVTVNPPLATSLTPSPLSNGPAVTNRSYGVGATCGSGETSACAPLVFTATGGTVESSASNYAYLVNPATALSAAGFNSCTAGGANGANYTCTAASVSAISAVDLSKVSVDDASNASTPASKPVELASSLTVNAPLSIPSSPVPPNALLGYQYALSPSFFTLAAQSGLSSNGIASWSVYAPAAPASPCPANTPGVLNGLSLDTTTGVISGTAITTGVVNFDSCGTDVANGSTPKGTGASAHPPDYSFTVVNPYAYVIDSGATAVDVIDTGAGSGAPSNPSVSVTGLTLTSPLGIAVTQDSLEAVAIVSTNEIAVIDTTTNLAAAKSPFSLASGNTCTTAKGIAIFGTTGYLLCDNGSSQSDVYVLPLAGLTVAGSSTITPTGSPIHLGTSVAPTAIAVSSDGSTLVVAEATATPALQIIQTSNGTLSPPTSLTLGTIPVAAVTAVNAPNIDAYVAETEAGSPGQVDVVSIDTTTFAGSLQSPVTFNKIGSTDPEPTCIAVTPDAARVYVGLSQTDQISVFTNSSNPGGLATAYSFPGLAAGAGTLAPAGVAIPPLNPALSPGDFRVFFTTTGASKGDVYYFDDNGGAPSGGSALILSLGSTSTPEGIAAIPVPTLP